MSEFDVFIIGGGPAGCAAAITLARAGLSVCIAEVRRPDEFKAGESLPPAVKPVLRDLGALAACEGPWALVSYGNQSAWGSAVLDETDFIRDPNGHGWHVDRARFDTVLRGLAGNAGAVVREQTKVRRIARDCGGWLVSLQDADGAADHRARWVLDCSGRTASFARAQGARPVIHDRLIAVVAIFQSDSGCSDRDTRTLIEAAPDGWWYASRVPGDRRVVAFHTDAATVVARNARTQHGFLTMLSDTRHISARIAGHGYQLAAPLRAMPANTVHLTPCAGEGWLAAGDAAVCFDPLSSQGILSALDGGLHAAQAIRGFDVGHAADAVRNYQDRIQKMLDAYLVNRAYYYQCETRWADRPFWKSRRR